MPYTSRDPGLMNHGKEFLKSTRLIERVIEENFARQARQVGRKRYPNSDEHYQQHALDVKTTDLPRQKGAKPLE